MDRNLLKKLAKLGIIIGGSLLALCLICFLLWLLVPLAWVSDYLSLSEVIETLNLGFKYGTLSDAVDELGGLVAVWRIASICKWIFLGLGLPVFGGGIVCLILYRKGVGYEGGMARPAAPRPAKTVRTAPVDGWKCPSCGRVNADGAQFCTGCGTKKPVVAPAPVRPTAPASAGIKCPVCGRVCAEGAAFCTGCGSKLAVPAPAPKVETKVCPACGAECLPDAKFCVHCGATIK